MARGYSPHESGTAVDVETPQMRWVVDQIGGATRVVEAPCARRVVAR
jgi:hypothetical protein